MLVCTKCGSTDVDQMMMGWFPCNGDWGSDQLSELSGLGDFYCNNCKNDCDVEEPDDEPDLDQQEREDFEGTEVNESEYMERL